MIIDHVGIAVANIEESLSFYGKAFGLEVVHREEVLSQKVKVAFLKGGETSIELLEPAAEGGAVAKFIKERGPGLHHVAFAVKNIKSEIARLTTAGIAPLEALPRAGARGHLVCFLHPRYAQGVLVEMVEHV